MKRNKTNTALTKFTSSKSGRRHSRSSRKAAIKAAQNIQQYRDAVAGCIEQLNRLKQAAEYPTFGELFPQSLPFPNGIETWSPFDCKSYLVGMGLGLLDAKLRLIKGALVTMNELQRPPNAFEMASLEELQRSIKVGLNVIEPDYVRCRKVWSGADPMKADKIPALAFSESELSLLRQWYLDEVAYAAMAVILDGRPTAQLTAYLKMPLRLFTKVVSRFSCSGIQSLHAVWPNAKGLKRYCPIMLYGRQWSQVLTKAGLI